MIEGLRILFLIGLLFFPVWGFGAEPVKFRHIQSIYFDEKGIGLKEPEGLAWHEKNLLIVADTGNGRLLRYSFQERNVTGGSEIKIPQLSNPIRV